MQRKAMPAPATRFSYQDFERLAPKALNGLYALSSSLQTLDAALVELLKLRASQINGCAFCVQYHLDLARKAGVPVAQLDLLAVWREAGVFSPRDMAALDWIEQLTQLNPRSAPDASRLQAHFTPEQTMTLSVLAAAINAWNRIALGLGFPTRPA
jgi:AhpD family alkylhydroperoxidase